MLRRFRKEKTSLVDEHIDVVLADMRKVAPSSKEYSNMMDMLEKLYGIKLKDNRPPVSSDTIALVAGNLMGILLIVAYEQKHVMTSKGFGHIIKPRT